MGKKLDVNAIVRGDGTILYRKGEFPYEDNILFKFFNE
jgi:hypothetical protein